MLSKGVQDVILMSKSAAFTVALYMGVITRFLKVNPCYFVLISLKKTNAVQYTVEQFYGQVSVRLFGECR